MDRLLKKLIICLSSFFLINCGGNDDYMDRIAFADADGSPQADGTIQNPFTVLEAIDSDKEVVIVLDSGGEILVNELQLHDGQQLIGAGSNGGASIHFQDGETATIASLGGRPVVKNDLSGVTISLSDNNRIEGLSIVTTSTEYSEPAIMGTSVSDTVLDDLIIESANRGITLTNIGALSVSNTSINSIGNAITIEKCHDLVDLSEISTTSTSSGKIAIFKNQGDLALTNISFIGGTEGGLDLFLNAGNAVLDGIHTSADAHGISLSSYSGGTFTVRNLDLNSSFSGVMISEGGDTLIENSSIRNSSAAIEIQSYAGRLTLNNVVIDNQQETGIVGISITNLSGETSLNEIKVLGEINSSIRITSNSGNIAVENFTSSSVTAGDTVRINDNQGTISFNNIDLSNGKSNAISIFADSSVNAIQISNSRISQFAGHGIELQYCDGSYSLDNVVMSNIAGDEVFFSYSPSAVVTRN